MKSGRRFAQLLVSAATMAAALTVAVAPAHAVTTQPAAAAGLPQTGIVITADTVGPSTDSATVHCRTNSLQGNVVSEPGGWPILAWFRQSTYWCYNGRVVTSHTTHYTGGITASGTLVGFNYLGVVSGSSGSYCYRAKGSTRTCSGVTEYAEGEFQACPVHVGCESNLVYLQSWENYKGQYFHN